MALRIKSQAANDFEARWFDYQDGISFKIASIDKDEYRIGIERARRLVERKESHLDLHNLSIDANDRSEMSIQAELMGRYIVQDWKGEILNDEGLAVGYTPENATALLQSNPNLVSWIMFKAVEVAMDSAQEQQEVVGKSSSASSGKGTGAAKPKNVR